MDIPRYIAATRYRGNKGLGITALVAYIHGTRHKSVRSRTNSNSQCCDMPRHRAVVVHSIDGCGDLDGCTSGASPSRFLIPKGYVGWVTIRHYAKDAPPSLTGDRYVYQIPASGTLATSSPIEGGWAHDEYFYYGNNDSLVPLHETGWGGGGMIWAGETISGGSTGNATSERFFVGTEEQFRRNEGGPISESH